MPRKTFTVGEVLEAAEVNQFLMDQAVATFPDVGARDTWSGPPEGAVCITTDTDQQWQRIGGVWCPRPGHVYRYWDEAQGESVQIPGAGGIITLHQGAVNMVEGCVYQFVCTATVNGVAPGQGSPLWHAQMELWVDGLHRRWVNESIFIGGAGYQMQLVHNFLPNGTRSWGFELKMGAPWFTTASQPIKVVRNYNAPTGLDIFCLGKKA